ncbi:MAG: AAA family ATPase, partial [Oscillospiraceae bacterium]|nr:AAA family ATPase [Oscillospiraceae bacterium]
MIIERITIGRFGGVKDFACDFTDGINLVEGRNEAGKTTISTFIKFIFYGLSGKAKSGELSERRKYQSWETDSADGALEFSHQGGRYRIERSLVPSARAQGKETVRIIDLATNTECLHGVNPGKYFFGVTEEVFLQTAFVGQADGNTVDGVSVAAAIENMLFAGDEMISTKSAQKKLEEGRTMLLYKNKKGGRIYELRNENDKLSRRLEVARTNHGAIISGEAERAELSAQLETGKAEAHMLSEKLARLEAQRGMEEFCHLARLKNASSELQKNYRAFVAANSYEGFLPDEAYVTALQEKYRAYSYEETELARETQRRQELGGDRMDAADRELLTKTAKDGGVTGITDSLERTRHRMRVNRIFGGVFLAMMVIWAVLASVCVFLPSIADLIVTGELTLRMMGYFIYGIGGLFGVLGIVFFTRGGSMERRIRKFLADYSVTGEQELFTHIRTAEKRRADQKLYEARRNDMDANVKRHTEQLEQIKQEATALLAKYNRPLETKESLLTVANECGVLIAKREELLAEIGRSTASVSAVEKTLEGEDEAKLRAILTRTERLGEIDEEDREQIQARY